MENITKRAAELISDIKSRYSDGQIRDGFKSRSPILCSELRELALAVHPRLTFAPEFKLEWCGYEILFPPKEEE